ncbi:uncharacterized protein LOC144864349 isoform X2 [Branchiostoma floridae x Branchiostoma japonicum]
MSKKLRGMLVLILLIILKETGPTAACSSRCSSRCDCSSRGLTSVPQDLPTTITELDLRSNSITTIGRNDFSRYRGLTNLDLGGNQMASLPTNIFLGLDNLQYLFLYNNRLTTLPSDIFEGLTNLYYLHMSSNRLPSLPPDIFQGLGKLGVLVLSGGVLTSLPAGIFAGLDNLRHLSLHGNQLTHLSADIFPVLASISSVSLNNNPWQCDCGMAPFKQMMTGSFEHSFEQEIICAGPGNLQGLSLLQDVSLEDLICEQTTIHSTFSSSYFIVQSNSSTSMAPPSTSTTHNGAGSTSSLFSLTVFLSAFLGVAAGALIVCGGLLAFWCHYRRMKRNPPSMPDSNNVVFSISNNGASVTFNGQGQAGHYEFGTELSEEYEAVDYPPSTSQPVAGHGQNRIEPPNPPPRSGDRADPQATDAILSDDTGHHYQPLRWA